MDHVDIRRLGWLTGLLNESMFSMYTLKMVWGYIFKTQDIGTYIPTYISRLHACKGATIHTCAQHHACKQNLLLGLTQTASHAVRID